MGREESSGHRWSVDSKPLLTNGRMILCRRTDPDPVTDDGFVLALLALGELGITAAVKSDRLKIFVIGPFPSSIR
jgi:hypothetical protein